MPEDSRSECSTCPNARSCPKRGAVKKPELESLEQRQLLSVNPIVAENLLPGTPESEWQVNGAGDPSIQGFTTDISINHGQTVYFKIDDKVLASYHLEIYRMGYYQGNGARLVTTISSANTLEIAQPAPLSDPVTGLQDCGNWAVSASWTVPANAVSGIYVANIVRDDTGSKSQIIFIVRADESQSDVLFKTSDSTWQAYNSYDYASGTDSGGNSFYVGGSQATAGQAFSRAVKVSYNRPLTVAGTPGGLGSYNSPLFAEYPMVRWLEQNGYDVSYVSTVDLDRQPALLENHKVFLSVGHDEYWSAAERQAVESARDAGVNIAFFSGNEMYWKTRWETSIDGSGTAYRTLVCYKDTHAQAFVDPSGIWTGQWRDPRFGPHDGGIPENALSGQIFAVNRDTVDIGTAMEVPAAYGDLRLWRNTSIAQLQPGQVAVLANATLGYEWDMDVDNGFRPAGMIAMSSTTHVVPEFLVDTYSGYGAPCPSCTGIAGAACGCVVAQETATHTLTMYRAASGALVFGAGTIQWSWGLDANHLNSELVPGGATADVRMQQATVNLLADMSVQPGSLQEGLVAATASTDFLAPTSTITSLTNGQNAIGGTRVTITGSAVDGGGGVTAGVEVSTDGGNTWHPATGRSTWTYSWVPGAPGAVQILTRATDDSANIETPSAGVTIHVLAPTGPLGVLTNSGSPLTTSVDIADTSPVELGMRFTSDINGMVSGVRFYKSAANTGVHIGNLWSSTGTLLATATFGNESASGWQEVSFSQPVAVSAGATYIVSYHTNAGHYSASTGAFLHSINNGPLHAPKSTAGTPNGLYVYSGASAFPTESFGASSYWVDVVFAASGTDTTAPVIISQSPAAGASLVATTSSVTVMFNEAIKSDATLSIVLTHGATTIPATVSYNAGTQTATLTPTSPLVANTTYTVTVGAMDLAGNPMNPASWSFTTTAGVAASIWSAGTLPAIQADSDSNAVEVGVKFQSSTAGYITAIRFFKGTTNTGTHVGHLWSSTGTLLATVTFTGETASGWQQMSLSNPVAIAANTIYIVSYFAPNGHYSVDGNYFTTGTTNGPLTALSNAAAGGNGVYLYGSGNAFPNQTFGSANYWVDVAFTTTPAVDNAAPMITSQSPAAGATGISVNAPVTVTFNEPVKSDATLSVVLKQGATTIPATVTYNVATQTATLTPNSNLAGNTTYTVTVSASDLAGNVMSPANWSFMTATTISASIWSAGAVPSVQAEADSNAVEVGVKFQSTMAGYVTAIRFFKGAANTGTHVGHLWSSTGTLLATVTFSGESASGWQQMSLSNPVAIAADTTYIVSYYAPNGHYAVDSNYFAGAGTTNGPLTALSNAAAGGNGVYTYGSGNNFPDQTYGSSNYWVDVAFTTTPPVDNAAPTISTRSPASGATGIAISAPVTVTFNEPVKNDATLSVVLKQGTTTIPATVTYNASTHTATLTPSSDLALNTTYTVTVSATDLAGNAMSPTNWSFTTMASISATIWSAGATPSVQADSDSSAVEVGVKFQSTTVGYVSAIRFYKGAGNTGTHVGHLWSSTGLLLATVTFSGETASGWQQMSLSNPVAIAANTTYIVSYFAPNGHYAADGNYFASAGTTNGPLTALSNAAAGGNGVYIYGSGSSFPNQTFGSTNYWVDVAFTTTPPVDNIAPTIVERTPAPAATGVAAGTAITVTFNERVKNDSTLSVVLKQGTTVILATLTYNAGSFTATLTPSAPLALSTTYTVTAGASDISGNAMAPVSWSFTTAATTTLTTSLFASNPTPDIIDSNDPNAVEVGMKFQASTAGTVTGIRFYKGAANTGTHIGHLWSSTGTLLASVTFTGETASGWQQMLFSSPVAISANTTYIVSYYAPNGHYSVNSNYFAAAATNGPLTAPSSAAAGGNGVYMYGAGNVFPNQTFAAAHYWVDILFETT